jgi:hypothetical protein
MDPVLVAGIVLIALLVGVTVLQSALRRRQGSVERGMPFVGELGALVLSEAEYPRGYTILYRGPVTNERLAVNAPDEASAFAEIDSAGRMMGYRQAFRDPKSYGEFIDVLLNLTTRKNAPHRQLDLQVVLYEDEEGAIEGIDEELPPNPHIDDEGNSLEVTTLDGHNLGFADSVRQWSRKAESGSELQRKLEVRWHAGRIGCFVSGDSEPPGSITAEEVLDLAKRVQQRVEQSTLRASAVKS